MLDPREGLAPDGTIRTGARRDRVPAPFEPVLAAAVEAVRGLSDGRAELHLYGSVGTGTARLGVSDVDLLVIGVPEGWSHEVGTALSSRFGDVCRGVEIGRARPADFRGEGDAVHGNRVFLHHYCVPLAGPDALRGARPFAGDARAARGFNGDIGTCLEGWRSVGADPRRVARKTLLAAAGVVSVHDTTWTTDRGTAARRWAELDPDRAVDIARILSWAQGRSTPSAAELGAALGADGVVTAVVERFASDVGLWSAR